MQTWHADELTEVRSRSRRSEAGLVDPPAARYQNVRPRERVASALAGGVALTWGLAHRTWSAKAAALLGSGLVYRGVTGHCPMYHALGVASTGEAGAVAALPSGRERAARSYNILRSVTVQKTAEQVYQAWHEPETFALVMSHFASLTSLPDQRTRWTLHDPLGGVHAWETSIVRDEPNKLVRWETDEHSELVKSLTLELAPAPGGRGTEMMLHLRLERPSGALGALLGKLLGKVPALVVERALGNAKCLLEAGELPSLKNNPAARRSARP
ncbi:MAG: hypothetical protein JWN04_6876 [Myxococcaceae bacterium]|nr:hypothetical protein [Myxococcaceae bacterium]